MIARSLLHRPRCIPFSRSNCAAPYIEKYRFKRSRLNEDAQRRTRIRRLFDVQRKKSTVYKTKREWKKRWSIFLFFFLELKCWSLESDDQRVTQWAGNNNGNGSPVSTRSRLRNNSPIIVKRAHTRRKDATREIGRYRRLGNWGNFWRQKLERGGYYVIRDRWLTAYWKMRGGRSDTRRSNTWRQRDRKWKWLAGARQVYRHNPPIHREK